MDGNMELPFLAAILSQRRYAAFSENQPLIFPVLLLFHLVLIIPWGLHLFTLEIGKGN